MSVTRNPSVCVEEKETAEGAMARRRRPLTPSASSRPASKSKTASLEIFRLPLKFAQLIFGKVGKQKWSISVGKGHST